MNIDITTLKENVLAVILTIGATVSDVFDLAEIVADKLNKGYVFGEILRETEKAVYVQHTITGRKGNLISVTTSSWFPKSQIDIIKNIDEDDVIVLLPKWLYWKTWDTATNKI